MRLTGQVSAMFQQYGDATLTAAAHTGSQPQITAFIKSGQKDSLLAAQGILDGVTADTLIPLVEVYDARQVKNSKFTHKEYWHTGKPGFESSLP